MGDNNFSLVDMGAVSDLGKHLLDKLEKLGHFVVTPKGTMPDAIDTYVKRIKEQNYPPLIEANLILNAKNDIRKVRNKAAIIQNALIQLSEMPQEIPNNEITPKQEEWYSRFFDSAQHISDEEIQLIWGKILAEECAFPNSVPKSLIHTLSIIDEESATEFNTLCSYFITIKGHNDLICNQNELLSFWNSKGISIDILNNLSSLGLIANTNQCYTFNLEHAYKKIINFNVPISVCGIPCTILYKTNPDMCKEIELGDILLTNSGRALFKCINKQVDDDCFEFVYKYIQKQIPHIVCSVDLEAGKYKE